MARGNSPATGPQSGSGVGKLCELRDGLVPVAGDQCQPLFKRLAGHQTERGGSQIPFRVARQVRRQSAGLGAQAIRGTRRQHEEHGENGIPGNGRGVEPAL